MSTTNRNKDARRALASSRESTDESYLMRVRARFSVPDAYKAEMARIRALPKREQYTALAELKRKADAKELPQFKAEGTR